MRLEEHTMSNHTIETLRPDAEQLLTKVRAERDELKLQLRLARAEMRDEWQKLAPRFQNLQSRVHEVGVSAGAATRDVGAASGLLGEELRHGCERIRRATHL